MNRFARRRPLSKNMVPFGHIDPLWMSRSHKSGLTPGGRVLQKLVASHTSDEPAHALAKAALHGDTTALGALHDYFDETNNELAQWNWRGLMKARQDEQSVLPPTGRGMMPYLFRTHDVLANKPNARVALDHRLTHEEMIRNRNKTLGLDQPKQSPELEAKIEEILKHVRAKNGLPEKNRRGKPTRYAKLYRVKPEMMNPLILGSRLGAILNEYQHQNPQDEASQIAHHALRNSDTREGHLEPTGFGVLADYMLEHPEHPLAKAFDWNRMMDKLKLDEDVHKAINYQNGPESVNQGYLSIGYDDPKLFDIVNMGSGGAKKSYRTEKFNHLFNHFKKNHPWIEEQDLVNSAARVYESRNRLNRMRQISDMRQENDPHLGGILDHWRTEKKEQQTIPPEGHHERFSRSKPTRLDSYQSPAGTGITVRGQYYPGGKFVPDESFETKPEAQQPGLLARIVQKIRPKRKQRV